MIQERLIEIRRELHQIPEIGLEEEKTQKRLLEIIRSIDKHYIEIKTWKTGILVFVGGNSPEKTIGWRSDIDGLPITEEVVSDFQSIHTGYMHACGHDFHMTIGLGLLEQLTLEQPKNNYLFLFQPAEENEAGGMLMYEAGSFGSWLPDEFYALHVNPDLPVGTVATRVGTLFAATCEVQITLKGKGGHAAFPHDSNDMIVAGMSLVQQAQTIVSRNVNPVEGAVVTFGTFNAGTATNVIAGEAKISGTIRTLTEEMNQLTQIRIKEIGEGIAKSFNCEVDVFLDQKGYLPVINNKETTENFIAFMKQESSVDFKEAEVAMTGEDFGYLLSKVPGTMFWLGVDSQYGLHSAQFNPKEEAIPFAVKYISSFLKSLDK
ncbi:N-acetyldiaminopimelate deacetylase [Enterococcus quebecensis]|uniref:N-acetyldiaminopimelate deacetylase n=1 Tax=Enterococcus quebecensis TaxID=903983 RepID=A0A1E5GZH1_9ENTE|nr:N-acetyldiaminopimelate deacetylase [Enterococcus quebecensis]OEG18121.1 N-acetyldiaminopimelate deacetylase [Enterococcus quebecensis]OJG71486.1 amidohydrolase [Enterococcus quebecensis]